MRKATPKLRAKKPVSAFKKPLKADFIGLFKGLSKGVGHAAIGKWEELGNDSVEALGAIGLVTEPGELASLLIQRSITRALYDLVGEIAAQYLTEVKTDASKLEEQLSFSIGSREVFIDDKFLDRPSENTLIKDLQPILENWLTLQGVPPNASSSISERLPSYFVYALNFEWRKNTKAYEPLIGALKTPFTKAGEREWAWATYVSLLEKRIHESVFDEPFSLAQLYVPLNAHYSSDTGLKKLMEGAARSAKDNRPIVVSLEAELSDWLNKKDSTDAIRVVSGGPGSGKSSFARIFAAQVAKTGETRVLFVPLHLIDATKNLVDEIARFVKDEGVLTQNPLDPDSPEQNLLIILDGLDELASQGKVAAETARAFIREVERTVEKSNIRSTRLRVLISGREVIVQENESEFRRPKQVLNLLPYFVPKQERNEFNNSKKLLEVDLRQNWWKNYGELTSRKFAGLPKELAREDLAEVTAQPLLNYLVALSFSRGKIDFSKEINLNVIYSDLVAAVYQRGYERKRTYGPIKHLSLDQFSRVLEEVGLAAWHGDGRTTTVKEIEEHCNLSGVGTLLKAFQEGAEAGVTRLLAAFFFRQHGQRASGDRTFVFTHKSFGEFLTGKRIVRAAEKLIREIEKRQDNPDEGWDEKEALKHWAQVCGPSPVSRYLQTFLLNEISLKEHANLVQWQNQLAKLFSFMLKHGLPMEQLQIPTFRESLFRARNAEEALLVVLNACARVTRQVSQIEHATPTSFALWFKRIQGQRTGSESSLAARCLSFLNLKGICLDIVDFYGADFTASNLSKTDLNIACLEHSKLFNANLSQANLWRANLQYSVLSGADLSKARLTDADLRHANFEGVPIGSFDVRDALTPGVQPETVGKQLTELSKKQSLEFRTTRLLEPAPKK